MSHPDEQGTLPVPGGRVWYRRIGDGAGTPLLLLHGGPGLSSACLADWLGDLPASRPVVLYDQLGGGRSDRPDDPSLWTLERFVEELGVVRAELGLETVNLLGHSWGTMLVASYLATGPEGVRSVVFSSPCLDARQWALDQQGLLADLPADVRETIERCEREGRTDSEDYATAMAAHSQQHVVRLDPWPQNVVDMLQDLNLDVYGHMWGSSEWNVTGTLSGFDARDVLPTIEVPVLFTAGEHDEARPETVRSHADLVPDATMHVFDGASHLTYLEVPEDYRGVVGGFLDERGL